MVLNLGLGQILFTTQGGSDWGTGGRGGGGVVVDGDGPRGESGFSGEG